MKFITVAFIIMYSFVSLGAEGDREKDTTGKFPIKNESGMPLQGILRTNPPPQKRSDNRGVIKAVEFHLDPPSLPVPSLPNREIDGDIVVLERLVSSYEYKTLIKRLYDDAEGKGIVKIAGLNRSEAIEQVTKMQATREYAQPVDIGNYKIVRAGDSAVIGRLMFTNYVFATTHNEGFLGVHFHLLSEFRDKGLAYEALGNLLRELIIHKTGKVCTFMRSVLRPEHQIYGSVDGRFTNTLRGIHAKSSLLLTHILDNNRTIATCFNAGFGVKLWDGDVIMSYPPDVYPSGAPLTRTEVEFVLRISKSMQDCREIKMKNLKATFKKSSDIIEEPTITLNEILTTRTLYMKKIEYIQNQYCLLLGTSEPFTFVSALNILHSEFGMTKEELSKVISVEKARTMDNILSRSTRVPNGLYFLRSFIPFTLHLSLSDDNQ